MAILLGSIIHSCCPLPIYFQKGIVFYAKTIIEFDIVFLGASISVHAVFSTGWSLLANIVFVIFVTILISFFLGQVLGLSLHLAMLASCGNVICGNSAIVAVAPVIKAKHEEATASIAFPTLLEVIIIMFLTFIYFLSRDN
ncbi:hypothetical protein MCY_01221 [Bartonella rattimassiliensis 15908]|uniref:Uncharacterized protein n=1 Tax=Bartonella rattimassiliensis 15908 TaxID=1094556 RepID=J1JGH2_9HYPH|nr:hypothetical protein MCY_01221 [Bartonella rattimassiliensis 15908]